MGAGLSTGNRNNRLYFSNSEVHFERYTLVVESTFDSTKFFKEKLSKLDQFYNLQNFLENAVENKSWAVESYFQ